MNSTFVMSDIDFSFYAVTVTAILLSVYSLDFLYRRPGRLLGWLVNDPVKANNLKKLAVSSPAHSAESAKKPSPWDEKAWWTDEGLYRLEYRAIFSKSWLFLTHASRFHKPGDYRTFEVAGFSVLLILGKDKQLRAFHNVCRHRAYTITKKESGSSIILGCRYHGWSYDTKGKLVKAPEFDGVEGFDKELNGLWEIKTEVRDGMVFINLETSPASQQFELSEKESLLKKWRVKDMNLIEEWKVEARLNWKFLEYLNLAEAMDVPSSPSILSYILERFQTGQETMNLCPASVVTKLPTGELATLRSVPNSSTTTTIECNIYGINQKDTSKAEKFKKDVEIEINRLEKLQREAIQSDENGVSIKEFQDSPARESNQAILKAHLDAERQLGAKIYPAARVQSFSDVGKADDDLCRHLEQSASGGVMCSANSTRLLDW